MIEGLKIIDLSVHEDQRGWFKENWRRSWLPGFQPVQQNVSFNAEAGTTRGLHAEPWDKLVSVATGRVFGAWYDLREDSPSHGQTQTVEITPDTAVFIPRGVANGFQALEDNTTYLYLVNAHWSPEARYTNISYRRIDWPLEPRNLSDKDREAPLEAPAIPARKILVTGADGQLGRALRKVLGKRGEFCSRAEFDITAPPERDWAQYAAIINAAAYNDVDGAENDRAAAWAVNATAPGRLAQIAQEYDLTLVHASTDYVFDGTQDCYSEDDQPAPLSFYGASKAAGEAAAAGAPKHYVVRTQWVYGEGGNFVDTMADLARRDVQPQVVHDQVGRITSAEELAKGIVHLLDTRSDYGIYHLTGGGDAVGRDEIAMAAFIALGKDPSDVHPTTTAAYYGERAHAERPQRTVLDTSKIEATGFRPGNWRANLAVYLA
ncbi:dTDP-4-dehydrorhamnose reductase [Corynebacterium yudongzhengii]|uniref:dTDP-4-dehydrorhamnose reductase n=1 Tax=Corynebacterium yudongzhengii TaxID=2080740 RepID=A0A2U1T512_9CORY|nr:dTDP-4-dehydrorhamnose reductase [Corynebacterium yudongzhengii]AWB81120.1 dTDP-4-dehydrorhamnose reductase [Corynebacterium yudongzhengii]PWC00978.1 dTDP-4-dehydrorhamnose reductase [Corynebacterium yudongzhengii]